MNIEISVKKILVTVVLLVACSMAGTLKDSRNGKTYKTVKLGKQTWMAENLNYKTKGSMCYDNKEGNCKEYGRLYTWEATINACPSGWHLPSKEEFDAFLEMVKLRTEQIVAQKKLNAEPLKEGEDKFYNHLRVSSWTNGFDSFGFSALPAGDYYSNLKSFNSLGDNTYFWSSTEDNSNNAYFLRISGGLAKVYRSAAGVLDGGKNDGYSVRCLQD
ncbi:MAG: fibrobacter succinogenes major paralogous domain-containing protein [Fibrobacter sp.]|nr:fibrobacter succinogenes major paralogous domain-containing protein [Fibrobacter sp.]